MSTTVIKDVLVRIGADSTQLDNALQSSLSSLKGWSVAGAAAVGAVTGAMVAFTVSAVKSAAQIENLAKVSNASTTEFQRMTAAAAMFGVEQDKIADILKDVNDRVGEFLSTGSGPMKDFFEQIAPKVGVTADQFRRLSGPEALQLYVSSLQKAGVNQQQLTFFMEALSGESSKLLPLLKNNGAALREAGDAAQRLGVILSEDTLEQLRSARESMVLAGQAITGFGNQIVASVAPALEVFAERLADVLTNNEEVQQAVTNLAKAFGGLTEQLSDPEVVEGLVKALELLVQVAGLAISGIVGIASNMELVTAAMGAAAIAVAALGGPLTLVASLAAAAAVGLGLLATGTDDAEGGSGSFQTAMSSNAKAIAQIGTASKEAREELYKLIRMQASAAGAAAEAIGVQLDAAIEGRDKAERALNGQALGPLDMLFPTGDLGRFNEYGEKIDQLTPKLQEAAGQTQVLAAQLRAVDDALNAPVPDSGSSGDSGGGTTFDPNAAGAGGGENPWASKLEGLVGQIAAEREILNEWYIEGQEILRAAKEQELITQEEFNQRSVELQKKYAAQMKAIDRGAWQERASAWSGALGDLASLMQTGNKKLFAIGKAAALAQAVVDGWSAATSAFDKGMKIGGPPTAAAFAAFSLARTGAMIASIASQQFEGGGGSRGGGGGGGGASAPEAAGPMGYSSFIIQGDVIGRQTGGELVKQINEAIAAGHRVNVEWQGQGALG